MAKFYRRITGDIPKHVVLAIGIFDGVHLGHLEILKRVREKAAEHKVNTLLMTFEPHPEKVLRGIDSLKNITPLNEKLKILENEVDIVLCLNFTREFSRQFPEEFVREYLWKPLLPRAVFVGKNFTFGRDAAGTPDILRKLGKEYGFEVNMVEPVEMNGVIVSSSSIRELVSEGDIDTANTLLGKRFFINGIVVKGKQRKIGFPTANLRTEWELIPANGVYAGVVFMNSNSYPGVVSIGTSPTFGKNELTIEVHILDFNENIYGKELRVEFIKKLREEIRFNNVEELKKQIEIDIRNTKKLLEISGVRR